MARPTEYVAECLWPDVDDRDPQALDERASAAAARLSGTGTSVRYIWPLLMRDDEVVLCLFRGELRAVRAAVEAASIPCERILESARSQW